MLQTEVAYVMVRWTPILAINWLQLAALGLLLMDHLPENHGQQFCGHSHHDDDRLNEIPDEPIWPPDIELLVRSKWLKRDKRNTRQQQQEEPLIDETDEPKSDAQQRQPDTSARVECQRSSPRLRSTRLATGRGLSAAAAQSQEEDCDVKVIETAVFLDSALDSKFSGLSNGLVELNKLVLTIMNQVQHLFSYSSMKIPVKIKLVLIEHLKDSAKKGAGQMPDAQGGDIDAYLTNFCNWQANRLKIEKRLWWDHAILLSGLDLYKASQGKNHSEVLGLAWVGGMCKGNYSCTINEATNLESAFVIAHEIGHSLGIMHDGQRNGCDPNGYIMSERTGAGKIHWSRCSINYLRDYINKRQLGCLDSEQSGSSASSSDPIYDLDKLRPPGQVYPVNEQCKLAFGSNYTSFVTSQSPFNAVCRELWCVSGSWAKAAHPALEGSFCGATKNRTCREGKCL